MTDLLSLADRVEAASVDDERDLLREAFMVIHGPKPPRHHGGSAELTAWLAAYNPFYQMIYNAKAFVDAALSLIPPDLLDEIEITTLYHIARVTLYQGPFYGNNKCNSIPLAITAAALRARAAQGEG